MKIHMVEIGYDTYQTVRMPEGSVPVSASESGDKIGVFFLGPDTLVGEYLVEVGVHVLPTGVKFPDDLRLFPVPHPLVNRVDQPNARFLATVKHHHIFLGEPR